MARLWTKCLFRLPLWRLAICGCLLWGSPARAGIPAGWAGFDVDRHSEALFDYAREHGSRYTNRRGDEFFGLDLDRVECVQLADRDLWRCTSHDPEGRSVSLDLDPSREDHRRVLGILRFFRDVEPDDIERWSTVTRFALTGVDLVCTRGGGSRGCSFNMPTRRDREQSLRFSLDEDEGLEPLFEIARRAGEEKPLLLAADVERWVLRFEHTACVPAGESWRCHLRGDPPAVVSVTLEPGRELHLLILGLLSRFRDEAAPPLVGGFASAPAELTCWRDGEGGGDCEIRMVPRLPG